MKKHQTSLVAGPTCDNQPLRLFPARSLWILSLLLVAGIGHAFAQTQFAGWAGTFQNYKLTKKTGLYFDGQLRSTGQLQQVHSLLLRPGLNIYFNPAFTGTVGYAYIHQQRSAGGIMDYIPEHRIWEQLVYTHSLAHSTRSHSHHGVPAATLTHRLRLEQRYLPRFHAEGNSLAHNGHAHAGRLRYFARSVIPLSPSSDPDGKALAAAPFTTGFFAAIQNEIFVNISGSSAVNGKFFDQNRAYLAVGYRYSRQFDLEMGYMNQYISGAGSNSTNNHILQVATYLRL
jgi:hypothetical protein